MAESKMSPREAMSLLHPNAADKVKATRWWAYATMLDQVLYGGHIPDRAIYVGTLPSGHGIAGVESDGMANFRRVLRELAHECEALALVEATK